MIRRVGLLGALAIAVAVAVAGFDCSSNGGPGVAELEAQLLRPEQLPGEWSEREDDATQVAGGFCRLEELVERSDPSAQSHVALVRGELLVRQSLLPYGDEEEARRALRTLRTRLGECAGDEEAEELGLSVKDLAASEPETSAHRLSVHVASVPLTLDLVAWRQGVVLVIARVSYPHGEVADPEALLDRIIDETRGTDEAASRAGAPTVPRSITSV